MDSAKVVGQEISVPITGVDFIAAGAHGPFRIYTRNSANSQLKDMTNSFGSIFVTDTITEDTNLSVSLVTGTEVPVYTPADLHFSYSVNYDVYPNDVLMLVADDDWTVATTPTCTSVDVVGEDTNYFKSVRNDLNLDCVSSKTNNIVYIYGLGVDIDTNIAGGDDNVLTFKFKVTGFTSPSADKPIS